MRKGPHDKLNLTADDGDDMLGEFLTLVKIRCSTVLIRVCSSDPGNRARFACNRSYV